jgi:hypothetical protein
MPIPHRYLSQAIDDGLLALAEANRGVTWLMDDYRFTNEKD